MIPEVRSIMRNQPWNPEQNMDWYLIKGVWDSYCRRNGSNVFIEGSPPNLLRCSEIRKVFDEVARYIAFISSPYMQIASSLYNYKAPNNFASVALTNEWLRKAQCVREVVEGYKDISLVSYEAFCRAPRVVNEALDIPVIDGYQVYGKHNTRIQTIVDSSARTISFLRADEIDGINELLMERADLIEFFGYELKRGRDLLKELSVDVEQYKAGVDRRSAWEQAGGRPDKVRKRVAKSSNGRA